MADPRSLARDQSAEEYQPHIGITPQGGAAGFAAAPPVANTGLTDGIKALSGIEPALNNFVDAREADDKVKDTARARADALANAMELSAAVKAGKIAPTQSKWYMEAYKQQYGEVLGDQWTAEAKQAWSTNPDRNSDNPNAADNFIKQFTADKLKSVGGDQAVLAGAVPRLQAMGNTMREAQATYTNHQVAEKNLENFGTLVSGDVDTFINAHGGMSEATLNDQIKQRVKLASLQGVDFESANKEVVNAFVNKARETGSFAMLKTLKSIDHIGNNPKYASAIRGAEDAIVSRAAANESRAWTAQQRADKAAAKSGAATMVEWIIDNPGKPVPPEMKKSLARIDPTTLIEVDKWHTHDVGNVEKQTPQEIDRVEKAIYAAGPDAQNEVSRQITTGVLKDPSEVKRLLGVARELSENHLASDKTFQDAEQRIKEFGQASNMGSKELLLNPQAVDDGILGYKREYVQWRIAHPTASFLERQDKSDELEAAYIKNIKTTGSKIKIDDGYVPGSARNLPAPAVQPLPSGGMRATGSTALTSPLSTTEQARRDELLRKQQGN